MGSRLWQHRLLAATLIAGLEAVPLAASAQEAVPYGVPTGNPAPAGQSGSATPGAAPLRRVPIGGAIELKVRRLSDSVELVIEGVGAAPQLQQTTRGASWEGMLITAGSSSLRKGPQRLALPEAGLQSISIDGQGTTYRLLVTPMAGYPVGRPVVSADGRDLVLSFAAPAQESAQSFQPNLSVPGRVPQPSFVPPLQPRAVAPPVGDMAVGTMMLNNPSYVNVSGPPVTMMINNAPVKDVLMAISRLGGYGFVYVDDADAKFKDFDKRKISISFRNESYGRALNSALLAAGLQGKRDGTMIMAGPNVLAKSFGATMSKVYRLNQASANAAADYLANLGASVTKTNTITTAVTEGASTQQAVQGGPNLATTTASRTTQVETYGSATGPLVGLLATTDTRLSSITLVGAPQVVAVAEQYLKQIDLRQRQVALSVKILDVDLTNNKDVDNSFAFRWGNNFIVNNSGQLLGAFGQVLPPTDDVFSRQISPDTKLEIDQAGLITVTADAGVNAIGGAQFGTQNPQPVASGFSAGTRRNPGLSYGRDNFYDFVKAQIESRSTKVLASPTLILQENASLLRDGGSSGGGDDDNSGLGKANIDEPIGRRRGNEGLVRVGVDVPTKVSSTEVSNSGTVTCDISELTTAGLVLGARVEKIDDNGFVTFSLSPSISAVRDQISSGSGCPPISILSIRRLDTGSVRVRDGQTLILTGVISDLDREEVKKWPVLGDIPLVGQFFRASGRSREKRELVIMVTPRIINDDQGGSFGYGYQPGTSQARDLMRLNSR